MKFIRSYLYILALLLSSHLTSAQNNASYFDFIEDPLKIPKGEEQKHLNYALTLIKQDSIVKGYQVLWRVRESGSMDSIRVSNILKTTKHRISKQYDKLLRSSWLLNYEGYSARLKKNDSVRSEEIVISKRKIKFYEKGKLIKEYKYKSEIQIDPLFGFIGYLVKYKNHPEEWIYNLGNNAMKSTRLSLEPKEGAIDSKYYAVYTRLSNSK
jgi:hypothetical protein